jgi:uncharacterized membrane protein
MHPWPLHYFPLAPLFMLLLLAAFVVVVALLELGVLTYAYEKIGVQRRYLFLVLLASLFGSAINIPVAEFPAEDVVVQHPYYLFGMCYVVPEVQHRGQTILAVNLGGAVIPTALSLYLLAKRGIYAEAAIGVAVMTGACHLLAKPVPGVGIAMPWLVPPVLAAVVAVVISRREAAPLAYISGSMGCLLGADILNLHRIAELGSPVASIGGAGVSDGIFLTGIIAVLLA